MADIFVVSLTRILDSLEKIPLHVVTKLKMWTTTVRKFGLMEARKIRGYHDEPLKGTRQGQRSIRLNKSYRAIYTIEFDEGISFIEVIEVHKHEY